MIAHVAQSPSAATSARPGCATAAILGSSTDITPFRLDHTPASTYPNGVNTRGPLLLALALAACKDGPDEDCLATYRRILELAHRNHDPVQMADFMTACTEHHDTERLACIREAPTAGAALACKAQKHRPD
jgi:hypothetical protein